MRRSCRIPILSLASTLAVSGVALAEKGVLVLQVSDLHEQPVAGLILETAGDGSRGMTADDGKTRIILAPQTQPGDWVTLQIVQKERGEKAWVFISPWNSQVIVPPFENKSDHFFPIRVATKGARELAENPEAARTMAKRREREQRPKSTMAENQPDVALTRTAQEFGLPPQKVSKAIQAWTPQDSYDQGVKAASVGDYEKSLPLFEESLKLAENKLGANKNEIVEIASSYGDALYWKGRYGEAVQAFEKGLAQRPEDLALLNEVGQALFQTADYAGARARFQKILTLASAASRAEPLEVLYAKLNLAQTLLQQGEIQEARKLGEQVLPEMQQALGKESPDTLNAINLLATILQKQGDLSGARERWEQLLILSRKVMSERYQEIIKTNFAGFLSDQGDLEGARKLQQEVVDAWMKDLGADDPEFLTAQSNLAATLEALGKLRAARTLAAEVLERLKRVRGKEHPDTLAAMDTLAAISRKQGDHAESLALYQKDLEIRERVQGKEHPDTLAVQEGLALELQDQGDLAGARMRQEKGLEATSRVLGEENTSTLNFKDDLAVTLRLQGELPRARELADQVLAGFRKALGETAPFTLMAMDHLALTLRAQGDLEGARKLLDSVVESRRRTLGPRHLDTSESEWELASTLHQMGQDDAARPFLSSLLWLLEAEQEDLSHQQREIASHLPALLKK
jgi:Flp pilus assembly protein TadD